MPPLTITNKESAERNQIIKQVGKSLGVLASAFRFLNISTEFLNEQLSDSFEHI